MLCQLNLYFFLYHFGAILVELLQVRGSIPLPWEQVVDLTYKPKFELLKHDEAVSGCWLLYLWGLHLTFYMYFIAISLLEMQRQVLERHFLDLRKKYGAVLAVDLVNKVNILSLHNELEHLSDDWQFYLMIAVYVIAL